MKKLYLSFSNPETWRNYITEIFTKEDWLRLRLTILKRDNYTCRYCGFRAEEWQIVHHIDGDPNNNKETNLETICPMCNLIHHAGQGCVIQRIVDLYNKCNYSQNEIVRITRKLRAINKTDRDIINFLGLKKKVPFEMDHNYLVNLYGFITSRRALENWRQKALEYGYETDKAPHLDLSTKSEEIIYKLMEIPLVGYTRASALLDMGIKDVKQLADSIIINDSSKYSCFSGGSFLMVRYYAKAVASNKPVIVGRHPFFSRPENIYFFDAEYDPTGTKGGPVGIFLLGIMNRKGETKQIFLDNPKYERKILFDLRSWLIKEKPVLVAYSSSSAEMPQLVNAFERFSIPITELKKTFFDVFSDCIFTQKIEKQYIYLPIKSMGLEEVSAFFGYKAPKKMGITDGLEALIEYKRYLKIRKSKIKKELLEYNKIDLEKTKYIYDTLNQLMINQG